MSVPFTTSSAALATTLSLLAGAPAVAPTPTATPPTATPGRTPASDRGCTGAPPQRYTLFPLRGCALVPANPGWANESCFGDEGAYYCREVAGHPQLNVAPQANWLVYKSDVMSYSGYDPRWGMALVHRSGYPFEGCGTWVRFIEADGSTDYTSFCDYKMNKDHLGPRRWALDPGGWGYFYDVLRNWASQTYERELGCATTIASTWTGAADVTDVLPACGGVFG